MPDLSTEAAQKFWIEYKDPMIHRVLIFMETVEKWTLDGNSDVEAILKEYGKAIDNIDKVDLGNEDNIIALANQLKMSRTLRMLQALDTAKPGTASKLLIHAEETTKGKDNHGTFLRRNVVFERLRLLARVFSNERLNLITQALEGEFDEHH